MQPDTAVEMIYEMNQCLSFHCATASSETKCAIPEKIHTPTTEGIGNSGGWGGCNPQEIPGGGGVRRTKKFPGGCLPPISRL